MVNNYYCCEVIGSRLEQTEIFLARAKVEVLKLSLSSSLRAFKPNFSVDSGPEILGVLGSGLSLLCLIQSGRVHIPLKIQLVENSKIIHRSRMDETISRIIHTLHIPRIS